MKVQTLGEMRVKRRATICAVLIVKDEEAVLERCLESVNWVDQIVVYDTGSTDSTRDIARRFTDTVIEGYWDDDFGATRNRALAFATGDWVLSIDADETFESSPGALRKRLDGLRRGVYAVSILNETSPLTPPEMTVGPRFFSRTEHIWRGRLHEQVRLANGSSTPPAGVLPGVQLRHTGYAVDVVIGKDKPSRNLEVVRAQLQEALSSGDRAEIGEARIHLVRSLVFAGEYSEARANAEQAWNDVDLQRLKGQLAQSMLGLEIADGDLDAAESWTRRWGDAEPGLPYVGLSLAKILEARHEHAEALAVFRALPVETTAADGTRFQRWSAAHIEVAALIGLGRLDEAFDVTRAGLRRGVRVFRSVEVLGSFGAERFTRLLDELNPRQWRDWCQQCIERPSGAGLEVLNLVFQHRPSDLVAPVCASRLTQLMDLEQAGEWSARLRRLGLSDDCTLLGFAADQRRPARDRALAAALVFSAYKDNRALPELEQALAEVPEADQAQLEAELTVVAPGLVVHT